MPIIPAATGTVPSARAFSRSNGSLRAPTASCPRRTSTSSSLFRASFAGWPDTIPKLVYDAFFHATADTLLQLGRKRFGAELGATLVLHTWTRELRHHPHLHAIVTCGGLAIDDARWVPGSRKYLFPVAAMSKLLRAKMMVSLSRLHAKGQLEGFNDFRDPEGFDRLMHRLGSVPWVTYAKRPFRLADHVLRYLGRYTHRVAISNSRLVNVTDQLVTFRTRNGKTASLHPVEFLARFVQHVLPAGFVKIRHYGLHA